MTQQPPRGSRGSRPAGTRFARARDSRSQSSHSASCGASLPRPRPLHCHCRGVDMGAVRALPPAPHLSPTPMPAAARARQPCIRRRARPCDRQAVQNRCSPRHCPQTTTTQSGRLRSFSGTSFARPERGSATGASLPSRARPPRHPAAIRHSHESFALPFARLCPPDVAHIRSAPEVRSLGAGTGARATA
eukprot:365168-Chlamydomonas_euryale.AAC.10